MFEIREIYRVRSLEINGKVLDHEVYNSARKAGPLQRLLASPRKFNTVCVVPVYIDKTAHTAQMIADALNAKLSNALGGVANDDPWNAPVPLEHSEKG